MTLDRAPAADAVGNDGITNDVMNMEATKRMKILFIPIPNCLYTEEVYKRMINVKFKTL